jgi:exopolysaccharide biosynthesis polyprenyl glycosylphosphotransferase
MINARRNLLLNAFKLFDLGVVISMFLLAALVVLEQSQSRTITMMEFVSMRIRVHNVAIFLLLLLVWHCIFNLAGLYTSRRLSGFWGEVVDIIKAVSIGSVTIAVGALAFRIQMVSYLFVAVFWILMTCATLASRIVLRGMLGWARRRGRNLRDVVIIGTNRRAIDFAQRLLSHPERGYRIIGFVDQDWAGMEEFRRTGHTLASEIRTFPQLLRNTVVDEVVLALPFRSMHDQASKIAASCEEQGITVRVLSNIFDLKIAHCFAEELEGDALITQSTGWVQGWAVIVKRVLDFTLSLISIVLLSPVLLVVAVLIRATSPGPVVFVQKRLGLNKRPFNLYKFRTMVADAEKRMSEVEHLNQVSGPVFKITNDPRLTPLGKILRKTSIDELPQLLNVVAGDMSLVGPRPLPVRDCKGFNEDWQRRRFSVKPGMTCLWQVRGRSAIGFDKWMELDLQYIDKWSLGLDFKILLQTIPAVVRGLGAV